MSFQVCGFIITALGNMQPSQQMWRNRLGQLAAVVAEPIAGVTRDVELAVGIGGQTVAAGLVVRAGAVHRGVVLGDVEVDGPGPQGRGQRVVGLRRSVAGRSSRNPCGSRASSGAL